MADELTEQQTIEQLENELQYATGKTYEELATRLNGLRQHLLRLKFGDDGWKPTT